MTVHTRYTFEDGTLTGIDIRLREQARHLPPSPPPPAPAPSPAEEPVAAPEDFAAEAAVSPVTASALPEAVPMLCAASEPPTAKKRGIMGSIRALWFVVFTAVGESLTYALNNLTSLDLPPGTATAVGAVGYGVKKAIWPDTPL